eukprot:TRINITY_DN22373_c0_g1_i1.p1 TRINITY_DN22373_c0_g1~~TRINITY_DN22373_c0_g1_i1.p1  ORF type:complete len:121 (-),score=22.48 TRINITY_DN22373_c0_g1_i1:137-499(-)
MMFFLLSLLFLMSVSFAQQSSLGNCQFSRDCEAHALCHDLTDSVCVCNFGKCVYWGIPFFRGSECNEFTDCACRNDPASCFCIDGFCDETKLECHEPADCNKLSKCRDKKLCLCRKLMRV